jgi:uncharacterized protein YceK
MHALRIFAALFAITLLAGCGTINSFAQGCGGVYSGIQTDIEYLASYDEFRDGWDFASVGLDVPISTVSDTLALPVTAFLKPGVNKDIGCHWTH